MKRWLFVAAVIPIFALVPFSEGLAKVRTHAFYLSTMGGGYFFESDEHLENSPVYTLGIGYSFSDRWLGEIVTGHMNTRDENNNDQIDGYPLRLDVLYSFRTKERLVPHLAVGLGWFLLNGEDTDLESVVGYGFGLRYFVGRSLALRADLRHLFVRQNLRFEKGQGNNHLMANAGVAFQIGGRKIPPPQIDSDGDGVIDAFDRCPGTPLGVPVDVYGCPADSDGDGVPDYRDLCPDTPFGVEVDKHGCPLHDAKTATSSPDISPPRAVQLVPSARPAIPRIMEPVLDETTKVVMEITLFIPFVIGQTDIRPESAAELKRAVDFVRSRPERLIVVEGHTDSIGSAEANLELSQMRAEVVRRHLLQETGFASEQIVIRGYGESRPVGDNATQEGRLRNRRIVIRAE